MTTIFIAEKSGLIQLRYADSLKEHNILKAMDIFTARDVLYETKPD